MVSCSYQSYVSDVLASKDIMYRGTRSRFPTLSEQDIEDLFQDTMIFQLERGFEQFDPKNKRASITKWFYEKMKLNAIDFLRKKSRSYETVDQRIDTLPSRRYRGSHDVSSRFDAEELLRPLTPSDRNLVEAYVLEGVTFREMAETMSRHHSTLSLRYQKALDVMKDKYMKL